MEKKYQLNEEQKNFHTEPNYNYKIKSISIDKINFRNRLEYSKKLQNKHLINIHKLFSKGKYSISDKRRDSQFPLFNKTISNNNSIRLKQTGNSYIFKIRSEDQIEKEKLITQIFRIEDEINEKNEELNEYRDFYHHLQENNLTFKAIIEKLLNIEENTQINNENNETNNENNKIEEIKNKNKNKYTDKKIKRLKLQIINYDKDIEEKEKFLDKTKNTKKINNFIFINKLLNEKNRELETLVSKSKNYQYYQHDMEKKINFYFSSIKSYRENYTKLKDKLKINEKELILSEKDIEQSKQEIEDYYNKLYKLEEELKILENNNSKKKEEVDKIKEVYDTQKDLQKEKEIIEKDLENINNKVYNIKKIMEKNNRNIIRIKYENEELQNDISILKEENNIVNEKAKQNQKGKQSLKNYEKDIKQMKEEINKNKLKLKEILNKEKEDKERIKKEIEEFEKAKIGLIYKINELTEELKEKTKENNIKEEELNKANDEYNNIMKEKKSNN